MSKGAKKYIFKTGKGETLTIERGNQEKAVERLAELVSSIKDWPHVRIVKVKG